MTQARIVNEFGLWQLEVVRKGDAEAEYFHLTPLTEPVLGNREYRVYQVTSKELLASEHRRILYVITGETNVPWLYVSDVCTTIPVTNPALTPEALFKQLVDTTLAWLPLEAKDTLLESPLAGGRVLIVASTGRHYYLLRIRHDVKTSQWVIEQFSASHDL